MFPHIGDVVLVTANFINNYGNSQTWAASMKNIEIDVLNVKLDTMIPFTKYSVMFMIGLMLHKVSVDKNGYYIDNYGSVTTTYVFEDAYQGSSSMGVSMAHYPDDDDASDDALSYAAASTKKVCEDDRCKSCGTMGEVKGLCCTCPQCGKTVWGA